jgi:hypothetical protein
MSAPSTFPLSFRSVYAHSRDKAYLVAGHDRASEQEVPVSYVLRWTGEWGSHQVPLVATGISAAHFPDLNVLIMGADGTIVRWDSKGQFQPELVDPSEDGPQFYGPLQEIRRIQSRIYVVGMGRTVYRCDGPARWARLDDNIRVADEVDSEVGLMSIDGFSESDMYAVGWNGELWHYDGTRWEPVESPTNMGLFRVICGGDGAVYACGQEGTLLRGRDASWSVVSQTETADDFWGATWFRNSLYVSTSNWIYRLTRETIEPLEIQSSGIPLIFAQGASFGRLDATDGRMWSVGEKMALFTEDGMRWTETSYQ